MHKIHLVLYLEQKCKWNKWCYLHWHYAWAMIDVSVFTLDGGSFPIYFWYINYLIYLFHDCFRTIQWLRYWIDVKLVKEYKCKINIHIQYMSIHYPRRRINFMLRNEYDISISIHAGSKILLKLLNTCFMNSLTFKSFFS